MTRAPVARFAGVLILTTCVLWATANRSASAANLVTNGGFETGDFTGWSISGPQTSGPYITVLGPFMDAVQLNPYNGSNYFAGLGFNGSDGTISQTIATTPGTTYAFSYAYFAEPGTPNDFTASFGGNPVFSVVNDTSDNTNPITWSQQSYIVTATSTSTVISFTSRNDPDYDGLDSVSLVAVPEPSALVALFGLAVAGLTFGATRQRRGRA
jgi:hypothetical protein